MYTMQNLIDLAKKEIKEDVEIQLAPKEIETNMQRKGIPACYDSNNDIIFYSNIVMKSRCEKL